MKRAVRKNIGVVSAILGLMVLGLVVAGYILDHQRLAFPWDDNYTVSADFGNAQAVTPGQGQAVTVAGVKVGEIGKVALHDGRARVDLTIERDKLPAVYADATMLIRPRTPLQDMTVEIDPGSDKFPELGEGRILPVARTAGQVNVDEVLSGLDSDTRAWFKTVLAAGGRGFGNRGAQLRQVFKASAPTLESTRRVTAAINARKSALRHAVGNFRKLSDALVGQERNAATLVDAGAATFDALGSQDAALRKSLDELPPTLAAADRASTDLRPLLDAAGPALTRLQPAVERLPHTLRALDPLFRTGTPAAKDLTTLATAAKPLLRDLTPALSGLNRATPDLTTSFSVLRRLSNELFYNPAPPQHGYAFWLAWFAHNGNSLVSNQDANGSFWRGSVGISCDPLTAGAPAELVKLIGPLIASLGVCS
jgi:phospholipid/cholesterol/gamma-HCH transport system substrate-binding protein